MKKATFATLAMICVLGLATIASAQTPTATPTPPPTGGSSPPLLDVRPQEPRQKQAKTDDEGNETVRVSSNLVSMTVTVVDRFGRFIAGLPKAAFHIFDNKTEQEITHFDSTDAPLDVWVVFDVSGSMEKDKIQKSKEALAQFVATSNPKDTYHLIVFNKVVELVEGDIHDPQTLLDKLTYVETKNNTALYDAIYLAVERAKDHQRKTGTNKKTVILLISDGQDNESRYTLSDVKKAVREEEIPIYTIGILSQVDQGSMLGLEGEGVLESLSHVSGGKSYVPRTSAEMEQNFTEIALELRNQYSIGYRLPNTDGKKHSVRVDVKEKGKSYRAQHKTSYVAKPKVE